MPRGISHIIEIIVLTTRTHTLLTGRRTAIVAAFMAGEDVLELNHARVNEHQGRIIVWNQRRAINNLMAVSLEKAQKSGSNIIQAGHNITLKICISLLI